MDKESLLGQIRNTLEDLLSQTQRLENEAQPLHQIDKDLLLEKTRALYEKLMVLEQAHQEKRMPEPEKSISVPDSEPAPEEPEEPQEIIPEPEEEPAKPVEPVAEDIPTAEKTAEPVLPAEQPAGPPKEMLDLFSEVPPETLGDSLSSAEKPAVADSLQTNSISDLREAIGINDKFLFINELFNGDLERYNKVIDELNGFSGLIGAQTYLTELQVQYQWDEESAAYQKLSSLPERKFA